MWKWASSGSCATPQSSALPLSLRSWPHMPGPGWLATTFASNQQEGGRCVTWKLLRHFQSELRHTVLPCIRGWCGNVFLLSIYVPSWKHYHSSKRKMDVGGAASHLRDLATALSIAQRLTLCLIHKVWINCSHLFFYMKDWRSSGPGFTCCYVNKNSKRLFTKMFPFCNGK